MLPHKRSLVIYHIKGVASQCAPKWNCHTELAFSHWLQVDVIVTTAGGIEEDLIKCLAPTYKGDFSLPGALLRSKGLNRIGNLLVPNENYCKFEDWIIPIFDQMLKEQMEEVIPSILHSI